MTDYVPGLIPPTKRRLSERLAAAKADKAFVFGVVVGIAIALFSGAACLSHVAHAEVDSLGDPKGQR